MRKMISSAAVIVGMLLASASITPVAAQSVTAPAKAEQPLVKITCGAAVVRSAPRKSSRRVGVVYRGQTVRILKGLRAERGWGFSHWQIRFKQHGQSQKRVGWIIFDCADFYRQ